MQTLFVTNKNNRNSCNILQYLSFCFLRESSLKIDNGTTSISGPATGSFTERSCEGNIH